METLRTVLGDAVVVCLFVFVAAWLIGAVYFGLKEPGGMRTLLRGNGRSMGSRLVLVVVIVAIAVLSGAKWQGFWAHLHFWNPVLAVIGAVVAVASTALLLWARWTLGSMWASVPLVQERHRLVTHGPYRLVRHPIYTGLLGMALAAALAFGFGVWTLVLVLSVPFVLRRVWREDRMMSDTFGAEYAAYRGEVPALFPSPRRTAASR